MVDCSRLSLGDQEHATSIHCTRGCVQHRQKKEIKDVSLERIKGSCAIWYLQMTVYTCNPKEHNNKVLKYMSNIKYRRNKKNQCFILYLQLENASLKTRFIRAPVWCNCVQVPLCNQGPEHFNPNTRKQWPWVWRPEGSSSHLAPTEMAYFILPLGWNASKKHKMKHSKGAVFSHLAKLCDMWGVSSSVPPPLLWPFPTSSNKNKQTKKKNTFYNSIKKC